MRAPTDYSQAWGKNTVNPSNSVASILPPSLPATSTHPPIRLIVHTPIPVSYYHIHSQIPELLADYEPDYVLHMGLHGGRPTFDLELSAPRTGFLHPDVYQKCFTLEEGDKVVPGVSVLPHQMESKTVNGAGPVETNATGKKEDLAEWPDRLETQLDRDKIVELWKRNCADLPDAKVTGNDGVGHYCCAFIYYTSLATFRRTKGKDVGPVLFLHMPNLTRDDELEHGRDIVVRLIDAIVSANKPL